MKDIERGVVRWRSYGHRKLSKLYEVEYGQKFLEIKKKCILCPVLGNKVFSKKRETTFSKYLSKTKFDLNCKAIRIRDITI